MSFFPSREIVKQIKEQYPAKTRVELLRMDDVHAPPIGTLGRVDFVDDTGTIFVSWDSGSCLGVAYGEDLCRIVNEREDK